MVPSRRTWLRQLHGTEWIERLNGTAEGKKNPGAKAPGFLLAPPWLLFRLAEIERRQLDLRHLDLDLVEIDVERLVEQAGHGPREGDHEQHHDRLQPDPGHGAPVDVRALYFLRRHAAQVEQRKSE